METLQELHFSVVLVGFGHLDSIDGYVWPGARSLVGTVSRSEVKLKVYLN